MGNDTDKPLWQWSATRIAAAVARREVSASEVLEAHIDRIEATQPTINALAFDLFDQARAAATQMDQKPPDLAVQPLCGVPISIKECFPVRGAPATLGLTTRKELQTEDCPQVQKLRAAGGIPIGVTNVPQLMIVHETKNPVYGETKNPWNPQRGVGGSSGGEAALVASGGSALGMGSDLGGSVRIPAHFCGVHGLKPTNRRLGRRGIVPNLRGMRGLEYQPGPIARHVEDLWLGMHVLSRADASWNGGETTPLPVSTLPRPQENLKGVRVGVWTDDGFFPASRAIVRVIEESVEILKWAGAEVIEFQPPDTLPALRHYFALVSADGGADFRRMLRGSVTDPEVARLVRLAQTPRWLRPMMARVLRARGEEKLAELFLASGPRSADSLWQATHRAQAFTWDYLDKLEAASLDFLLCPPHGLTAYPAGWSVDLMPAASYSIVMNLLGIPCGTVTCGRVLESEQEARFQTPPPKDPALRKAYGSDQQSAGLPVAVQLAARPWREEQLLQVMRLLEQEFRQRDNYPEIGLLPELG
ncbi:MAG: amidase family protein [Pirellulaceae bacterium]